ncbi:hypothetical protein WOLCODRAFT_140595 [Wolfiporia cocos MD-104 SS10]|uniref:Peroxin-3 n=1 Tax=Wolfiporia cocos (strain MD-104) TaxID=742152 RepID=A0A2H3J3R8_WOLCO|nr:hypothetical protein WOLCODRAFT_140595 [Wolfiporia cocos MD-104 SS10]
MDRQGQSRSSKLRRAAGFLGGAYLVGQYVLERLGDVRERVMQERLARENLRRRFAQNQQDVSYTIMALLPTLGKSILEGMDVERITHELQSLPKAAKAQPAAPAAPSRPGSDLGASVEYVSAAQDARSKDGSVSVISVQENGDGDASHLSDSSSSWVDQVSSMHTSELSQNISEGVSEGVSESGFRPVSPNAQIDSSMSDSYISSSSSSSVVEPSPIPPSLSSSTTSLTRSKAELWKEVKLLTFTRTLTVIYSMTLLSLFTHIQLNLLGRSKYIHSILQAEQDERLRENAPEDIESLLWPAELPYHSAQSDIRALADISEETERKYLTLTWWMLHVGWKDVGERVRKGVEDVFEGVPLKAKLTVQDLHRLICDVRRRVEHEVTFEKTDRQINFISALLPPTPEMLQHVLVQGGIPARAASAPDAQFAALLAETRTYILSGSFERVLEVCLDHATDVLVSGLHRHVFASAAAPGIDRIDGIEESRERLAAMLPGLARWCHLALEGLPNELVDGLANLREVSALSAIVYSSYEDHFR